MLTIYRLFNLSLSYFILLTATLCDTRWDINAMDQLPDYMKICFLALHNFVNEMALDTVKEQRFHIIEYLKKAVWN